MAKPWEKYAVGPVTLGTPSPRTQFEGPLAAADLAAKQQEARVRALEIAERERKLANDPNNPRPDPYDSLTGPDYLKHMPHAKAAQVQALVEGRMAFPTGRAAASPYWQEMLSAAAHVDPSFDAVNYNARNAVRKDFTSGKSAQNIKALNTAIGHLGQLNDQIDGTASHGGLPGATAVNAVQNFLAQSSGDSGITNFRQTAGALSGELTQVYRQSGGAEADIQRYLSELSPNASREQKQAAVKNMLGLLKSRLDALNDQYVKGMGTDKYQLPILDDHAKKVIGAVDPTLFNPGEGPNNGGTPPPNLGGPGQLDRTPEIKPSGPGGVQTEVATGETRNEVDPLASSTIEHLLRKHASPDEIAAAFPGYQHLDPQNVAKMQAWADANPKATGFVHVTKGVPVTPFERLSASPAAAFTAGVANAVPFADQAVAAGSAALGGDYAGTRDNLKAGKAALADLHPNYSGLGNLLGQGAMFAAAPEALARYAPALADMRFGRLGAEAAYGGAQGASDNPDNTLLGAAEGAGGALAGAGAGKLLARPLGAATRRIKGMLGSAGPSALNRGENTVLQAIQKASLPDVQAQLGESGRLGVPMAPVDTNPALTKIGGSAVRYSDNADKIAQDALLPRSRGQVDRLTSAINRDLGPTGNVPQLSQNLQDAAQSQARPLYEQAYAAGQVNDPQINALLQHPMLRSAFDDAQAMHANDVALAQAKGETPPAPLQKVYSLDPNNPAGFSLQTAPDVRTIDYIKRGLQRKIDSAYDGSDAQAKMHLPFLKEARNLILSRTDEAVPAYKAARAAYGGNMSASEALEAGKAGVTADPNQIGMDVGGLDKGNVPQFQLGYRSGLVDQANRLRYSTNPFASVLDNPAAEQRLGAVFPDNPGNANLLRQRDLEGQLARSSNDVLGNSKTAGRQVADQQFGESPGLGLATDLTTSAITGSPVPSLVRRGMAMAAKLPVANAIKNRKVAMADQMAPILFNTDPDAASSVLADLVRRGGAYQDYVNASRAPWENYLTRPSLAAAGGMLGSRGAQ